MPEKTKTSPRISPEQSSDTWSEIFKIRREIWKQLLYIKSVRSLIPGLLKISSKTTIPLPPELEKLNQAIQEKSVTETILNRAAYALSKIDESVMTRALRSVSDVASDRVTRANELKAELDDEKDYLVSISSEFVKMRARRDPTHIGQAELFQRGNVGLLQAIERYNPDMGFEFETYARQQIDKAIQGQTEKTSKGGREGNLTNASSLDIAGINAKTGGETTTAKDKLSEPGSDVSEPRDLGLENKLDAKDQAKRYELTQQAISELPEKHRLYWQVWMYAQDNNLTKKQFADELLKLGVGTNKGEPLGPGGLHDIHKRTTQKIADRVTELESEVDPEDLTDLEDISTTEDPSYVDMGKTPLSWQEKEQLRKERKLQNAIGTLKPMDQKFVAALEYREDNKLNDSDFIEYLNSQGITDPSGKPLTRDSADFKKNNIFNTLRMKLKTNMQEAKLMKLSRQKVDLRS